MKKLLFLIFAFVIISGCAPIDSDLHPTEKIGSYRSPFADGKFKLAEPTVVKSNSKSKQKMRPFNPDEDAISSSVLVNVNCAIAECQARSNEDQGRLTCFAAEKIRKEKWPIQINRHSFTFKFSQGEKIDDISKAFNADAIDQKCILGISNYGEFKFADFTRPATLNDPDIQLSQTAYAASPYLDQIGFFDSLNFSNSLQPSLAKIRVGVIDAEFVQFYEDLSYNVFDSNHSGFTSTYPVVGHGIINVGGAPIPSSCTGACHGSFVSQLIVGLNGNSKFGAGVVAGPKSEGGDTKIVALSVFRIDPVTGEKVISIDDVNNALALLTFKKVDVINISLGYDASPNSQPLTLLSSILSAIGSGSVVVVGAGNRSTNLTTKKNSAGADVNVLTYPGAWGVDYLGLISVGSLNQYGNNLASFSNYGPLNVDIAAPGEKLLVGGKTISGTSFSAPLVSAGVAVAKAYYLSKLGDSNLISAAQVELGFLEGMKSDSQLVDFIKDGKILDLKLLSTFIQSSQLADVPKAILDTDGFWYTRDGTSMQYSIRTKTSGISESETGLFVGIWEKLDMSLPPLAQFEAKNGIQNFSLPYHQFLVGDEGFWVVVYRLNTENKRIPISSKLYKFTDVVTSPSVSSTVVAGAINQINTDVSGWACLPSRPDRLKIEVRSQSPTGPVVASQITSHQPKGRDYFDSCTPFTVMMGFKIPLPAFLKNTDYYFIAVHPTDSNKNRVLNASAFRIEETQFSDPVVRDLKKKIDTEKVEVSGRVCWVDQPSPGIISNQLNPFIADSNQQVFTWLEGIMNGVPDLKAQYGSLFINKHNQAQRRFELFSDWLGLYTTAWSTTAGTTPVNPIARVSDFEKPFFISSVELKDSLLGSWGYGIVPILYWNDPNGVRDGTTLLQAPVFKDAVQSDFLAEPQTSLAGSGSGWTRSTQSAYSFYKRVNPEKYQTYSDWSVAVQRAAWDNPVNHYGSDLQTENDSTACSDINQSGVGQKFRISYTRARLSEEFFLGKSLLNRLNEETFVSVANQAQIDTWFSQYNTLYQQAVATGGPQLLKTIVDQGEFSIGLRFLSPAAGMKYQKLKLKELPNQ